MLSITPMEATMTRTEYCTALRKAGFSVKPFWQGSTATDETGQDLTCYGIYGADGTFLTRMVLQDCDDGLDVFFSSPNLRVSDDIAFLEHVAQQVAA